MTPDHHQGRRHEKDDGVVVREAECAGANGRDEPAGRGWTSVEAHQRIDDGSRQEIVQRKGLNDERPFPEERMNGQRRCGDRGRHPASGDAMRREPRQPQRRWQGLRSD